LHEEEGAEAEAEAADGERMLEELEALLRSFEEDEIQEANFARVTMEEPVLLLLAQHRSFRICRRKLFCPVENCHSNKPITSVGRLTLHMQMIHGASKEETTDMVRYFISRLLPGRIEAIVTTRDGRRVGGSWNLSRCHHPGCDYVKGEGFRVDGHVRARHKETQKDIKMPG
jgi:hypothetical protein